MNKAKLAKLAAKIINLTGATTATAIVLVAGSAAANAAIVEKEIIHVSANLPKCISTKRIGPVVLCDGYKQVNQHKAYYLSVNGPEPDEAVKNVLRDAVVAAAGACATGGYLASAGGPGAAAAACYAAAKVAFSAAISVHAFSGQYELALEERNWDD